MKRIRAEQTEQSDDPGSSGQDLPTGVAQADASSLGRRTLFKLAGATLAIAGIDITAASDDTTINPRQRRLGGAEFRFKNRPKDHIESPSTGHVPLDVEQVGDQLFVRSYRDGCYAVNLHTGKRNWKLGGNYTYSVHNGEASYLLSNHPGVGPEAHTFLRVDNTTGEVDWVADEHAFPSAKGALDSVLFVDSNGNLVTVTGVQDIHLSSIDPDTGEALWRYALGSRRRPGYLVLEDSSRIYVFPDDHPLYKSGDKSGDRRMVALDLDTGSELWSHEPRNLPEDPFRRYLSALDCGDKVCRRLPGGRLSALDKDTGEERWSRVIHGDRSAGSENYRLSYSAEAGIYVHHLKDDEPPTTQVLEHLDSESGRTRWAKDVRDVSTDKEYRRFHELRPEVREILDVTLIISESSVEAVERETGNELWSDSKPVEVFVREDQLYHVHDDRVEEVDPSSGEPLWSVELPEPAEHYRDVTPVPEQDRLYLVKKGYYTRAGGEKEGDELVVREMRRT